ncbi:unnamed protein product [Prorocentrum cordatum]|uniref:Uncharacterized protein n=1 Tax=Prorocentrum cordatum TaxID=2364126 RepID=A0ABN9WRQ3_9DINO|nr:unnamed protein product [Polarella glacialis]
MAALSELRRLAQPLGLRCYLDLCFQAAEGLLIRLQLGVEGGELLDEFLARLTLGLEGLAGPAKALLCLPAHTRGTRQLDSLGDLRRSTGLLQLASRACQLGLDVSATKMPDTPSGG